MKRRDDSPTDIQEEKICFLYNSGLRQSEVASKSGFCHSTIKKVLRKRGVPMRPRGVFKKGNGAVLNLNDSGLVAFKESWDRLDSTVKGSIAENYVKVRLSELGFDVWEPFCQNHKTDLFILKGKSILRIQVKSATYDRTTKAFRANVTRHRRNGKVTPYDAEDVDFFIVFCGGMDRPVFYVAPASAMAGRTDMKVYPHREKGAFSGGPSWDKYRDNFSLLGVPC